MSQNRDIRIYGAGMSGLVAAINLAREGHTVVVHDREQGFGGDALYNPSTHTTPLDVERTSKYIGIDIAPAFHPLVDCPFYFHDTRVSAPVSGLYTVERGNRPTSLDSLLYAEALKLGVQFEFGSPLKREDLPKLPPSTIIACGLTVDVYRLLEIPYLTWYGWISRGEIGFSGHSWIWMDESISEYGYLSSVNNYYFNLLFSIRPVTEKHLDTYRRFMVRNEGLEHDTWHRASGCVPIARPDNPRLKHKDLIMCGTISGFMDPMAWFGIAGALTSGRIAALAVSDPLRAEQEFRRFSRYFRTAFFIKNRLWYTLRPHVGLLEKAVRLAGEERLARLAARYVRADAHIPFAIPCYANLGCY